MGGLGLLTSIASEHCCQQTLQRMSSHLNGTGALPGAALPAPGSAPSNAVGTPAEQSWQGAGLRVRRNLENFVLVPCQIARPPGSGLPSVTHQQNAPSASGYGEPQNSLRSTKTTSNRWLQSKPGGCGMLVAPSDKPGAASWVPARPELPGPAREKKTNAAGWWHRPQLPKVPAVNRQRRYAQPTLVRRF